MKKHFRRAYPMIEAVESRLLMAIIPVLNNGDAGADTLRGAIAAAQAGDTIDLSGRTGTITLASALQIDKNLTITGPGADELTIDGNGTSRVFIINSNTTVSISGLTATNGSSGGANTYGGAVYNAGNLTLNQVAVTNSVAGRYGGGVYNIASLTMTDSSVTNNQVDATGDARGGGIMSDAAAGGVVLTRCTIAGNAIIALGDGFMGGQAYGGGVALLGNAGNTFTNCTFSSNTANAVAGGGFMGFASGAGGGVWQCAPGGGDFMNCTIVNNATTITGNGSGQGGGIDFFCGIGTITNCIVAGNTAPNMPDACNNATNGGNNLIGVYENAGMYTNGVNGDIVGTSADPVDPLIGALADNGGLTKTHALLAGSPAIDAGTSSGAPTSDQRGQARAAAVDIGAFEFVVANQAPTFSSTPITAATAGVAYGYNITAADGNNDELTISAAAPLPAWLSLVDNGDGSATLIGTPGDTDFGSIDISLNVTDDAASAQQDFTISVAVPDSSMNPDGLLRINGTAGDDDIHVWARGNDMRVIRNGVIKNYPLLLVTGVQVVTFGGDDSILSSASRLPVYVFSGEGRDSIIAGIGNDTITGGAGKDTIYGGTGNDRVNGGPGNDKLFGGLGNDRIYGNEGDDALVGDPGNDRVYGGAGDDLFLVRDSAADTLIGDEGTDSAEADGDDQLLDAIALLA